MTREQSETLGTITLIVTSFALGYCAAAQAGMNACLEMWGGHPDAAGMCQADARRTFFFMGDDE